MGKFVFQMGGGFIFKWGMCPMGGIILIGGVQKKKREGGGGGPCPHAPPPHYWKPCCVYKEYEVKNWYKSTGFTFVGSRKYKFSVVVVVVGFSRWEDEQIFGWWGE